MSTAAPAMMQNKRNVIEMEKKAKTFEIDLIEEAGILVTVKAKPNPKLAAVGEEVRKKEMHMLKPCGTSSRIIRLTHVVTEYDFESDEDYGNLLLDMTEDGERFGKLVNVVIPRPNPDHHLTPTPTPTPGVGKVFLEYADLDAASRARSAFNGKRFGLDNIVVAEFYPENMYAQGHLDA